MKKLLSLSAALTVGLMSFAQTFTLLDSPKYSWEEATVPTSLGMGTVYFTDYNNDNLLDLLISGRCYGGYWSCGFFRITGSNDGLTLDESMITKIDDWHTAARPIDFDNDGYIDYVMTGETGWRLFKNNAGTFEQVSFANADRYIKTNYNNDHKEMLYSQLLAVADMNNDGFQDIVTYFQENRNTVILQNNNGDGTFTEITSDAFGAFGGSSSVTVGDINNDGYLDIVIAGWGSNGSGIKIIFNNGDGTFTGKEQSAFGAEESTVILGDANGDGLLDIFFSGKTYHDSNWDKGVYMSLNTGDTDNNFTEVTAIVDGGDQKAYRGGLEVADLDGDGDLDLIFAGEYIDLCVYANDGNGNYSLMEGGSLTQIRGGVTISAADYDKDGAVDFAVMGYSGDGSNHFRIYHNDGDGKYSAPAAPANLTQDFTNGVKFSWSAVEGCSRYNLYVEKNDGTTFTTLPADITTGFLKVADINGAISANSYTLNGVAAEDIKSWGVQAINASKATSAFAKYDPTLAIENVAAEQVKVTVSHGQIFVNVDANVAIYDVVGRLCASQTVKAGEAVNAQLTTDNVYLVKVISANGTHTQKVIL